jgi:hypothetical protein
MVTWAATVTGQGVAMTSTMSQGAGMTVSAEGAMSASGMP